MAIRGVAASVGSITSARAPASAGAFFWRTPPIRDLERRLISESGTIPVVLGDALDDLRRGVASAHAPAGGLDGLGRGFLSA